MKIIAILTAAALGLTATAGLAQTSTIVSFADLDITSTAGHAVLVKRIARAASRVCDFNSGVSDLDSHIAARNCQTLAMANGMKALEAKTALKFAAR